ncbi:MAG: FIST N-terminal domain-containing protein [Gallionella sp.]|nr:FIST N-terminal domain-containing protein [Gallionella sp.]MDD4946326.1 FIST N-terminal domain-containing protein [Gallionella sp.]
MQIAQIAWSEKSGWQPAPDFAAQAHLVLIFADHDYFKTPACFEELRRMFPAAHIAGCSSSGNITGVTISDNNIVATVIRLERSHIRLESLEITSSKDSQQLGSGLMADLAAPDLRHAFILSDGLMVNGSELAKGLNLAQIPATGGMAGDGARFTQTFIMADAPARTGCIAALGFYGALTVRTGCFAGWEEFGAERIVSRSSGNVVYEIDGEPALDLYKKYLGEQAAELPASGLRFPLSIQPGKTDIALTRTLLGVNEEEHSLTFAGDVPQGYICKLMRTNLDNLIESAGMAADAARPDHPATEGLCVLVSCVGRRLVMGQMTEEELEIVQEKLGDATTLTGFYSYGELAPAGNTTQCELHNQTMTLTTFYE